MEETLVFIDEGFLDKLTKLLGNGIRLKFDKFEFAKKIAEKQNLICEHLFYYTAPPFQGTPPTKKEKSMKEGYDKFIFSLSKNKNITVREGRCQRIISSNGKIDYNQKGVDVLLTIDLSHIKEDFPEIKKVVLISSDTDFCPVIKDIEKREDIEIILYTYFDKKRGSKFSLSNELISCCSKYFKLTKQDFENAPLNKEEER
ncbi:MAG: NYN domain-containing protein [Nanoarchaeota archaeon]